MTSVQQPTPPDYRLVTRWELPAAPQRVWEVLADPDLNWPAWWPGLSADAPPVADGGVGSRATFALRPARLAYALHFALLITATDPPRSATMAVSGDLIGTGLVGIEPSPTGSVLELDWRVRTTKAWMVRGGRVLAPMFRFAHAHAMRRGERGLRAYLR